jgi:aryl-phospho-beta-D-glucosidase BglC (GH1 family)
MSGRFVKQCAQILLEVGLINWKLTTRPSLFVYSILLLSLVNSQQKTEKDFAEIAAAGLNFLRIPIGYWAIEVLDGEPFLPKVSWT